MGVFIKQRKTHLKSSLNMGNYFKSTVLFGCLLVRILHDQILHTQT